MKLTGPEAVPPEESSSLEERMRERLTPAPEPPLKIRPSSLYQSRIESIESSTARMKQALTCCGDARADVEPDRRVEAEYLVQQHPGQLVLEDLGVALGGEVAVLAAGRAVGAHHPVDELAQAATRAAGVPTAPRKYFVVTMLVALTLHDGGELDAALLEVDRAVAPVGHDDVAALPGHLVVGVHAGGGEDALDLQALAPARRLGRAPRARPAKRSSVSVMVWSSPWSWRARRGVDAAVVLRWLDRAAGDRAAIGVLGGRV